jgi:O-antigen/teichoic acid export membrane protein
LGRAYDGRTLAATSAHRASPALISSAGKTLELASQVLIVLVLARLLGPRDYGTFALALAFVAVLSHTVSAGGSTLMARFIPSVPRDQRPALARRLVRRVGRWRALEVTVFAEACAIATLVDPGTFAPVVCGLVAAAVAFEAAATLLFQIDLGLGRVGMFSFRFGVQNLALVAASATLYMLAGSDGAVAGILVASGAAFAWGAATVGRELARSRGGPEAVDPPLMWRFGLHQTVGGLLALVVQRGAVVAAAVLGASKSETGYAALGVGIGLAGSFAVAQAFAVNLPALADLARRDPVVADAAVVAFAWRALVAVAPLTLIAAALVHDAVPVVFGAGFRGAAGAIYVGLALMPLAPASSHLYQLAALRLARRQVLVSRAIGAVAFLAVAPIAVTRWQGLGAAIAVLAGTVATLVSARLELGRGASWPLIGASALASAGVLAIGATA